METSELISKLSQRDNEIAASLVSHYKTKGFLSPKQINLGVNLLSKVVMIDVPNILERFAKSPKISFRLPGGITLKKSYKGPQIAVLGEGKLLGFLPGEVDPIAAGVINLFEKDGVEAMVLYGRATGRCGVCGRTLLNKDSIELGIGPVCMEKVL